ncbi:MAG: MBL fold metallo-hydrolase [Burkholderiaceae bacterium]
MTHPLPFPSMPRRPSPRSRGAGWAAVLLLGLAGLLAGCAATPPAWYDAGKRHHRPDGFVNPYGPTIDKSIGDLVAWRWRAWREDLPAAPSAVIAGYQGFEVMRPDLAALAAMPPQRTLTWIGHATAWLQLGGLNVLTDPHFSERASPFRSLGPRRRVALPVELDQMPRIDLVVLSHNHPDSLDEATVARLRGQAGGPPLFLVPLGLKAWFEARGIDTVRELDWWDETRVGELRVWFVPAQHWSARSLTDRNESLWGGWVIQDAQDYRVWFAGDSGYTRDFAEIGARFGGVDLALLPVGAYEPRWFMAQAHVNPDEAVKAHLDVRSRLSIGIHWGTFELTDEPLDQPITDLAAALARYQVAPSSFRLLRHGETLRLTQ